MLFELREYRIKPGQSSKQIKYMEEEIIPFQISKGMVVLGSFTGKYDDNLYVWIRRFENENERTQQYERVYEDEYWKTNIEPNIPEMLDIENAVITQLIATKISLMRQIYEYFEKVI